LSTSPAPTLLAPTTPTSNFIRQVIDHDLAQRKHKAIATRFPPEPNGYLHIGHAKSICLNFGLARDYAHAAQQVGIEARCHMRFDDTNPVKEDQEYVDSILDSVSWLGFDWGKNLFYASDYFGKLYDFAESLVTAGYAYVDSQSADEMRSNRGTLTQAGTDSPFRTRSPADSLQLLREMRAGKHAEGSHILRAKIDMASPNINLRDPALYRIRITDHHRTGNTWCIYPMYDYAHPISDAIEGISHSICTLEFESHRPLYDWLLDKLASLGKFDKPLPQQIEFARLNLTYVVTSKRKLQELVQSGSVDGWDDPRMPTIVGLRRRGYTPSAIQLFCERIGVSKADSWIDMSTLEQSLRDDLDPKAHRGVAVLAPLKLILDNFPDDHAEPCKAPIHPHLPDLGERHFSLTKELWIERDDFQEVAPKGFFRLFPGNRVRLRYGFVIECTGCDKDEHGNVIAVHANYFADSKSGTPDSNNYKVKGNIHWVSVATGVRAEVRVFDKLFTEPHPDAGGRDYKEVLNKNAKKILTIVVEPSLANATQGQHFQFERHGYFVADNKDHRADKPVFNMAVSLKDSWAK
jgi:glutaminyl-tRNA synthetase